MESLLAAEQFAPIEFYRRDLVENKSLYRVYTTQQQFTEVEATSAFEAMQRSEVQNPLRIVRYAVKYLPVLPVELLKEPASIH